MSPHLVHRIPIQLDHMRLPSAFPRRVDVLLAIIEEDDLRAAHARSIFDVPVDLLVWLARADEMTGELECQAIQREETRIFTRRHLLPMSGVRVRQARR